MKPDNTISIISRIRDRVNHMLVEEMEKIGMVGLVPSHGDILVSLFKEHELTMTELSDRVNRDRSTMTALVGKLKQHGYVATKKHPNCGRTTIVYLTDKGRDLKEGCEEISLKLYEQQSQNISEEDMVIFRKVLEQIYNNFR